MRLRWRGCGPWRSAISRARAAPIEFEAETGYPGAPATRAAPGGETVAAPAAGVCARSPCSRDWATAPAIAARLKSLLGPQVVLSQAHHNCVMTKRPAIFARDRLAPRHPLLVVRAAGAGFGLDCAGPRAPRERLPARAARHAPHGVRGATSRRAPVPARRSCGEPSLLATRPRWSSTRATCSSSTRGSSTRRTQQHSGHEVLGSSSPMGRRTTGRFPERARPRCPAC